MVFAVGTLEADLVVAGVDVEPRPPRVPRPRADPLPCPPRCVMPSRTDPPREADLVTAGVGAGPRSPRDEPRPRTEPPCGAVPDGAEPAGGEPSGGAGPGDDPGKDASLTGTEGLTPPGGAELLSSGVPPEVPGASLAGVDPTSASPRSRLVVSQRVSRSSIADRSPTASPIAHSGESKSAEVVGTVVCNVSWHVVVVVLRELPVVKTARVQRGRDRRRLNEDNILTYPYTSRLRVVDPVGLAFLAESDEPAFPSTMLQLIGVDLFVHERPGPDHPKMAEIGNLGVERLVRRPVFQSCVKSPVAQVDAVFTSSPQRKFASVESGQVLPFLRSQVQSTPLAGSFIWTFKLL